MRAVLQKVRSFLLSDIYSAVVFLLAYGFVVFNRPVEAFCAMMVVLILVAFLSEDLVPMLLPLLLLFCSSLLCVWQVDELDWLFWVFVPTAGTALLYLFFRGLRHVRLGRSFPGLLAVTVAVTLGGLFAITPTDYFASASLYHVLGLGVMAIVLYIIFKGNAYVKREYAIGDKVASAMYLMAVFVAFMILRIPFMHPEILESEWPLALAISSHAIWRNIAATIMVMALPFIFYYARRSPLHLLSALFVYVAAVLSGSRGGLIIGALTFLLCFFAYVWHKPRWRTASFILLFALVAVVIWFREPILDFCETYLRLSFDEDIIESESRYRALFQAIGDFAAAPLFGTGLGAVNSDITSPLVTQWQIYWYHSLFPQIIGSLGLCGLAAYGYQFYLRLRILSDMKKGSFATAIMLSYVGTLLYSQIDPGIFAPLPVAALLVLFFVIAECERDPQNIQRKTP